VHLDKLPFGFLKEEENYSTQALAREIRLRAKPIKHLKNGNCQAKDYPANNHRVCRLGDYHVK